MKLNIDEKEINISKLNILVMLLLVIVIIFLVSVYVDSQNSEVIIKDEFSEKNIEDDESDKSQQNNEKSTEKNTDSTIDIYIVGCVKNPGVIKFKKGDLLDTAIKNAGGLTKEADSNKINMVFKLESNLMIKVLSKKEIEENSELANNTDGIELTMDGGEGVQANGADKNNLSEDKININLADENSLMTLPGVGEVLAKSIVDYRNENGNFKNIKELKNVNGIGDKKYDDIEKLVTI